MGEEVGIRESEFGSPAINGFINTLNSEVMNYSS